MQERILISSVNTIIILIIIPVAGVLIDYVAGLLVNFIARHFGSKTAYFIANRLTFIGTVHHELAHMLFALLSGAKVTDVNLFKPSGNTLGSVGIVPRGNKIVQSIQLTLSAIAPMILGAFTEYLLYYLLTTNNYIWYIDCVIYYTMVSIFIHMTMSKQDIKNAIKGLPICAVIIFLVFMATNVNLLTVIHNVVSF